MRLSNPYWTLLLFLVLSACEKWDLDQLNFLQLNIQDPIVLAVDSLSVTAGFSGLVTGRIEDHGFVWSRESDAPVLLSREGASSLGVLEGVPTGNFSDVIAGLNLNAQYFIRAYAIADGKVVYSNTVSLSTGTVQVILEGFRYEKGNTLEITARIKDLGKKGVSAIRHGFCWSIETTLPTYTDEVADLGSRQNSEPFTYLMKDLQSNTGRYMRPFAIVNTEGHLDTLYGTVAYFDGKLKDFWVELSPDQIPFLTAEWTDLGSGFYLVENEEVIYQLLPVDGDFILLHVTDYPFAYAFVIDGYVYGFEKFLPDSYNFQKNTLDFYAFNLVDKVFEQRTSFPSSDTNFIQSYALGAKFAANGKGYYGGGLTQELGLSGDYGNYYSVFTDQFWSYDPPSDSWTQLNNLPKSAETKVIVWDDQIYLYPHTSYFISIHLSPNFYFQTIYRYDIENDTWNAVTQVPGGENGTSVILGLGKTLYVGGGKDLLYNLPSNQWWSYSLLSNKWTRLAEIANGKKLPPTPRSLTGSIQDSTIVVSGSDYYGVKFALQYFP